MKWAQCDKPNPENCKNCSSKCAYDCARLQFTVQHRTVLIISPSYLQTNIITQMLSIRGEGTGVLDLMALKEPITYSLTGSLVLLFSTEQPGLRDAAWQADESDGVKTRKRAAAEGRNSGLCFALLLSPTWLVFASKNICKYIKRRSRAICHTNSRSCHGLVKMCWWLDVTHGSVLHMYTLVGTLQRMSPATGKI